ncbi:hypothetical protein [Brevundimonas sp. AJA228-03]|nr:hypothetical protein [Brevundimonas sp. AJA228-03]
MRILTVLFALGILATVVLIVPTTGRRMLIKAQSISPTMPAMRG